MEIICRKHKGQQSRTLLEGGSVDILSKDVESQEFTVEETFRKGHWGVARKRGQSRRGNVNKSRLD